MIVDLQYAGFLNSNSLWNTDIVNIPIFKFIKETSDEQKEIVVTIPENEVFGKRMEHFFEYYINNQDKFEVLIKNLQIFNNKITIGELDFIIRDVQLNQILHIELVCKFYLYIPDANNNNEFEKWIGPNKKDSLSKKIINLQQKQLPLLYKDETISALAN